DGLARGVQRHDVGALDHDIGRGEVDTRGANGVDRQERDVPRALLQRVDYLAGGIEGDEFDRDRETLGELARKLRRDPARLSARRVLLRQHDIAAVDRRAQLTARRELGDDVAWNILSHGV